MPDPINFQAELSDVLLDRHSDSHTELDQRTFRASSVGYCPRQILLSKIGAKRFDAQTQGRFQVGDFIHDYIQTEILPGHMTTHENEVVYEEDGLRFKGHYDCFDGAVLYDFKSRNGWWYYDNDHLPKDHHLDQLHVYMKALGVEHGLMVYVNKADLTVETYPDYFGVDTSRWTNREEKTQFEEGNLQPGHFTKTEHGQLVEFEPERWERIKEKARKVQTYLELSGFPESIDEVDDTFPNCGGDGCLGCKFEDGDEFDFSHIQGGNGE